jgi:predicted RNase H-like HicB family nuclease
MGFDPRTEKVKTMQKTIKAIIYPGETQYIAECAGFNIVTQGKTLDETVANLREAVDLYLEGEDLSELGLPTNPAIVVTFEIEPLAHAQ